MAQSTVMIDGDWYISLHHHDGQFVRRGGRFAFARKDIDGGRTLFCLEDADDISRSAGVGHPAWAHAVERGMTELLVHLRDARAPLSPSGAHIEAPPLRYELFDADGLAGRADQAA